MTLPDKKIPDELDLIAEHIGDDQPNLPEGAKNTILLAAKAIKEMRASVLRLEYHKGRAMNERDRLRDVVAKLLENPPAEEASKP